MKFHFSLEAVLRYRKMVEKRERLALETIQQDISTTVKSIEQLRRTELDRKLLLEQQLLNGTSAVYLHQANAEMNWLKSQHKVLSATLEDLEERRIVQMKALQYAQQEREVLSEMRQQKLKCVAAEQARKEQKVIDDLFLSRREIKK